MAKKELPNKELPELEAELKPEPSGLWSRISSYPARLFSVTKLILGIVCGLPLVYAVSAAFLKEFALLDYRLQNNFWSGMAAFLIIYLFVWEPAIIYAKGQKLLEVIFNFFRPLVRVAPYLLPVFTIVLFIVYGLLSLMVRAGWLLAYSMFLSGFSIALHLVFSARSMRSKKGDFLKANYVFGFSFIYIINVFILAFCLNLIFKDYSFVNFFNGSFQTAKNIFSAVFKQLFLL